MPFAIASIALAADASWLGTRALGEATLVSVAAIVVGFVVWRVWPRSLSPQLFGALAAFALLGGLAYLGVGGAGLALALFILVAIILGAASLVM